MAAKGLVTKKIHNQRVRTGAKWVQPAFPSVDETFGTTSAMAESAVTTIAFPNGKCDVVSPGGCRAVVLMCLGRQCISGITEPRKLAASSGDAWMARHA